jgi:hypothetical protein
MKTIEELSTPGISGCNFFTGVRVQVGVIVALIISPVDINGLLALLSGPLRLNHYSNYM